MKQIRLLTMLALLMTAATGAWATPNSIVINGTPQIGDKSISLTYHFDPNNVPGITSFAPTLKVKCAADNKWDETNLSLHEVSSGTTSISLSNLGEFKAGKTYEVCFAYNNGSWVDDVFQSFVPAAPATYTVTLAEGTEDADKWTITPNTGLKQGDNVTVTYTGSKKVIGVKAEKKAAAPAVKPVATVTTAPQAKTDVEAGSTTALIEAGVADGGTLMYAVTTTNTKPNSTDGFSATVPTAQTCAAGTVYVWYYVKADDSHTDSDIAGPVSVTVKAAALSESFTTNQRIATYDGTHFTITCTTVGDSDGIEIEDNKPLTITAKNGETITKVEFHCTYGSNYTSQTTVTAGTLNWTNLSATGSIDKVNASTVSMSNSTKDWVQINQITVYYAE